METIILTDDLAMSESGFMFVANTGESFTSNETARFILERIREGLSQNKIIERIIDEYEIDKKSAELDLTDFISKLHSLNLVRVK